MVAGQMAHHLWMDHRYIGTSMEKIYSPSLVYSGYLKFMYSKLLQRNILLPLLGFYIFMVSLNVLGKSILLSVEMKEIVFAPLDLLVSQMEYVGLFIPILIGLYIVFASGMWFQKFTIRQNKIVDLFPKEKEFSLSDIVRIVLFSPNLGQIHLQSVSNKLMHSVYWHGNNEKEWLDFLNILVSQRPSIKNKIYINTGKWRVGKIEISTVEDSYSEILKIYHK